MPDNAIVNAKGARRWAGGHPWIFKSDVKQFPQLPAGVVTVTEASGRMLGCALWSPTSEISLRMLDRDPSPSLNTDWWTEKLRPVVARRNELLGKTNAFRLVHGEADGIPSLICDRYDRWLVVQIMSAGLERYRTEITTALVTLTQAQGVLARNDVSLREREKLPRDVELLHGDVPREIEVVEHGIKYIAAPWDGQKTGAFLDQRENRVMVGSLAKGRALDCFSYHGSFALHAAQRADSVIALDSSTAALERAGRNIDLNNFANISLVEANAFDYLREAVRNGHRFETVVLDPPAFAKTRGSLPGAIRGYKEINLRALRILSTGGLLYTASCSFHMTKGLFFEMLQDAAADSGRRVAIRAICGQPLDHPELLTVPETGYIKGAILEALD